MHDSVKRGYAQYYQPLHELSVDKRMVKSKARSHFRQYIRNKPTKWGFNYWVLADPTGYTLDFDLYCGEAQDNSNFRAWVVLRCHNGSYPDVSTSGILLIYGQLLYHPCTGEITEREGHRNHRHPEDQ